MIEYIAEIGWNFLGDYALAEKMIEEAANSGATYAKFQYWNPNKLKPGSWDVDGRKEIYKKAALGINGLQNLQKLCDKYEIKFLTSVFNQEDAGIIKELGIHEIKIPSHEIVNENLHHYAAENFKRIYVSLGAGNFAEIEKAISIYNEHSSDFIGMHCVAAYPCPQEKINLNKIKKFTKICNRVGFSDHTREISTPAFAVLMGATVIEKHFTIDNLSLIHI